MFNRSSTLAIPEYSEHPKHIAIIMDGNGRWAAKRALPRTVGHIYGKRSVHRTIRYCLSHQIPYLTLFAFSSENWRRPASEVSLLMTLFIRTLRRDLHKLSRNGVKLQVVGDLSAFSPELQAEIQHAEQATAHHSTLTLTICANYGGRWDILQAVRRLLDCEPHLKASEIDEQSLMPYLSMSQLPEPDLLIRTGGECRLSNFLIWQLAYTELYFTDVYWPDVNDEVLDAACHWYATRERRFGRTSAQLSRGE